MARHSFLVRAFKGSNPFIPFSFYILVCFHLMLKLIFFFYLNRSSLSINFVKKAFYRKFKRIKQRLVNVDKQDKVFFF